MSVRFIDSGQSSSSCICIVMKIVYFRIIHIYEINILSMNYDFFFSVYKYIVGGEISILSKAGWTRDWDENVQYISYSQGQGHLCCYCTQVNGLIFYKLLNSFRQSEKLITLWEPAFEPIFKLNQLFTINLGMQLSMKIYRQYFAYSPNNM